jgi:hypothetical protein
VTQALQAKAGGVSKGRFVGADTLAATPSSALNKLDRAVPSLARLKARGEGWDLSGAVTAALRQIIHAESRGVSVDAWFNSLQKRLPQELRLQGIS